MRGIRACRGSGRLSWRDRPTDEGWPYGQTGRPGGDWQGIRPTFDNPMSWSVPLGRVAGITVRIHAIFLVFVLIEILRSLYAAPEQNRIALGPGPVLILLLCLWWTVLLHEFGHCIACRMTGGHADEILMWPLGGLARCSPPSRWTAHFWTAVGGPLVNVIILAIVVPVLGVTTGRWLGVALPSPLDLGGLIHVSHSWWLTSLYLLAWVNVLLLLFNLLPMYPLDGGQIAQSLMWPRLGYAHAMRVAVRAGYIGAIALGVLGLVIDETMLVLVAVFGGVTCWITSRQLEWTEQFMGHELQPDDADEDDEAEERARATRLDEARAEAEALDHVLRKISVSGLNSLTARERKLLNRATEQRRRERRDPRKDPE